MAVSAWMAQAGLAPDALAQARQADMASFEAYLIEAATAVGDDYLATVDFRWDLAAAAIGNLSDLPEGLPQAVTQLREVLLGTVGPAEQDALLATFEPVRLPAA
jgi:L-arabinose isomerase